MMKLPDQMNAASTASPAPVKFDLVEEAMIAVLFGK
jgi:hypothetical protein